MASTCVFCGSAPTTNEHVWPDWARRRLRVDQPVPHTSRLQFEGQPVEEQTWELRPYDLTVNAVCAKCNSGWMSELEGQAQPLLTPMIEGRGRALHRDGQRTLAAWATKTALMFEQTSPRKARAIPSSVYESLADAREPTSDIRIWVRPYTGATIGTTRYFSLAAARRGEPEPVSPNVFVRTFTIGRTAFQLVGGAAIVEMGIEFGARGPARHQLWPYAGSFTWMPGPAMTDYELALFADEVPAELMARTTRVAR